MTVLMDREMIERDMHEDTARPPGLRASLRSEKQNIGKRVEAKTINKILRQDYIQ